MRRWIGGGEDKFKEKDCGMWEQKGNFIKGAVRIYLIFQCLFPFDRNIALFEFECEEEYRRIMQRMKEEKKKDNNFGDETESEEDTSNELNSVDLLLEDNEKFFTQ